MDRVAELEIIPVRGIGLAKVGDDVAELIFEGLRKSGITLEDGDVVVVAHSLISKAEGKIVQLEEITPSQHAINLAKITGKDPRQVEVVLRNASKVIRVGHGVIICESFHGFVCANAGVDASNSGGEDFLITLPDDPDASAHRIRSGLRKLTGVDVAVVITDSWGRPFRKGAVNVAIGCSGINPLDDLRGRKDLYGRVLRSKVICIADQIASAAGLVMGEADEGIPAAIVRGLRYDKTNIPAKTIIRAEDDDLFR
ncbi:MAG: coenzyme F420-0:L-glutamate ligase [Candidatus Caldarchaeum sp.]